MNVKTAFWHSDVYLPDTAAFQVVLTCPDEVDLARTAFTALHLSFSDGRPDVVLKSAEGTTDHIDLGDVPISGGQEIRGSLKWKEGRRLVLTGRLVGETEGDVQVGGW